jgi:hypothetical protein
MNKEEQRIAIAEACGWKRSDLRPSWCHPDNWSMAKNGSYEVWVSRDKLPDYLNDLNAMHEAEKMSLSGSTAWLEFAVNLMRVLEAEQMSELNGMTCILQATARQRAEAFLRTIGKWKEAKP